MQLNWFQNAQLLLKILPKVQYTFTHDQQTPCKASGRPYDFSIFLMVIFTAKLRLFGRLFRCFLVVLFEFCFIVVTFTLLLLFTSFLMNINRSVTSFLLWILLLGFISFFFCPLFLDYFYSHNFPCRCSCVSCHSYSYFLLLLASSVIDFLTAQI